MPKVLIPLATGCEELEAVSLIDILRRADIEVITASLGEERTVQCSRDTVLIADVTLDTVLDQDFDMIVLPGGLPGADHLNDDPRIHQLIKHHAEKKALVGAICAAPQVLHKAGLLQNKKATAYPGFLEQNNFQSTGAAVEKDDNIITSRGPGTALDFALEIVGILSGTDKRNQIEADLVRG